MLQIIESTDKQNIGTVLDTSNIKAGDLIKLAGGMEVIISSVNKEGDVLVASSPNYIINLIKV